MKLNKFYVEFYFTFTHYWLSGTEIELNKIYCLTIFLHSVCKVCDLLCNAFANTFELMENHRQSFFVVKL